MRRGCGEGGLGGKKMKVKTRYVSSNPGGAKNSKVRFFYCPLEVWNCPGKRTIVKVRLESAWQAQTHVMQKVGFDC